jgi:hypothetical protein
MDETGVMLTDAAHALRELIEKVEPKSGAVTTAHTLTAGLGSDGYVVADAEAFMLEYAALKLWGFEQYATSTVPLTKGISGQDDDRVQAGYRSFANSGPTILKRRSFETRSGMLGLGPLATATDDIVVVLFGGTVPFVLRPDADKQRYRLVGECYVHDVMNGEAVVSGKEVAFLRWTFICIEFRVGNCPRTNSTFMMKSQNPQKPT